MNYFIESTIGSTPVDAPAPSHGDAVECHAEPPTCGCLDRLIVIHRTYFLEEDVWEGDFPRDNVRTETFECDDVDDAVRIINREGLTFGASGSDWAANPDGTRITNYTTAERVEETAHIKGGAWTEDEIAEIMDRCW
jgi:hypothetical protein